MSKHLLTEIQEEFELGGGGNTYFYIVVIYVLLLKMCTSRLTWSLDHTQDCLMDLRFIFLFNLAAVGKFIARLRKPKKGIFSD